MIEMKKWMVGLDLTLTDETLISYTRRLADALKPEKIYFIHIQKDYDLPDELGLDSSDKPSRESIREQLREKVKDYFDEKMIACEVYHGDVSYDLWRESYLHDVDLFIAGSKPAKKGRGLMPKQFARKSFCSVLFVPDEVNLQIERIFAPIDFSDYSKMALEVVFDLARALKSSVICQNIYELPYAYSLTDAPRQRFVEIMEKNASLKFEEFVSDMDTASIEIDGIFEVRDYPYVAEHIKKEAEAQHADLIIMAAGGKSKLSKIFLGSETERMIGMEKDVPLMILKKKESLNIWDAITG